jgi:hypothetical protein
MTCAQPGHPSKAAAPIAALDKLLRKFRLSFMGVVPKKLSVRVYQTAGPEKERSQNRTGSPF